MNLVAAQQIQPEASSILKHGLVVFSPEPVEGWHPDYTGQVEWEHRSLQRADVILFWVPRDLAVMPAFTTNIEFGAWYDSGKVVFGAPPAAPKNDYLHHLAESRGVPVAATLEGTVDAALGMVGAGAHREGGECSVPLLVWQTPSFQAWYTAQRRAGNTLLDARVEWTFQVGPDRDFMLYWAAHVQVHVAAEDRIKSNEVVISRPDAVQVALYHPGPTLEATVVVLVREFRTPASGPDAMVHELPGGSGPDPMTPLDQAVIEVREETGLRLEADRLRWHGSRQVAATAMAHHAHLFSAAITHAELTWLRSHLDTPHGAAGTSERTWVEVCTYGELKHGRSVDWATLGMIAQALGDR